MGFGGGASRAGLPARRNPLAPPPPNSYKPMFLQQLLNGLTPGCVYALIALGYTMIYGVLGLINFAQGEIYLCGAFVAVLLLGTGRVNFYLPFTGGYGLAWPPVWR